MFLPTLVTPEEAVRLVHSGDRVYVGSNCGQPVTLCEALTARAHELQDVRVFHLLTFGPAPYVEPGLETHIKHTAFFVAGNTREAVQAGRADYLPVFLSDVPRLFDSRAIDLDVALVSVSPPDQDGQCSLGISVDLAVSACRNARTVIAEIQPEMPRTRGQSRVPMSKFDAVCMAKYGILEHPSPPPDRVSQAIASNVRQLVSDGACIQVGFGRLPSAVLDAFHDLSDLGLHTEMFSDSVVDLVHNGNVTNRFKTVLPGVATCTFALGTKRLFTEIEDNPFYEFHPTEFGNDPFIIAQNDSMVAINCATQIDLTGQVVADSIDGKVYSGIGGQVDFVRGASRSRGGKPIIALPATAKSGSVSRIVPQLTPGNGVVTSRGDVHWVVTEFGAVNLHGRPIRDRSRMLIEIADPRSRDELRAFSKSMLP